MKGHWLIETFTRYGRPVVFLASLCLTLGLLFVSVQAKEIAVVMLLSGGVALSALVVLGYQRRRTLSRRTP